MKQILIRIPNEAYERLKRSALAVARQDYSDLSFVQQFAAGVVAGIEGGSGEKTFSLLTVSEGSEQEH